jgi:hypothetical protein
MVHFVTEVDFVTGEDVADAAAHNYEKHLAEAIRDAAQNLSLRTIRSTQVGNVLIAEIKD